MSILPLASRRKVCVCKESGGNVEQFWEAFLYFVVEILCATAEASGISQNQHSEKINLHQSFTPSGQEWGHISAKEECKEKTHAVTWTDRVFKKSMQPQWHLCVHWKEAQTIGLASGLLKTLLPIKLLLGFGSENNIFSPRGIFGHFRDRTQWAPLSNHAEERKGRRVDFHWNMLHFEYMAWWSSALAFCHSASVMVRTQPPLSMHSLECS